MDRDSCIVCEESFIVGPHGICVWDNLDYDDFTRYPDTCPSCCVDIDESVAEYRRLGIEIVKEDYWTQQLDDKLDRYQYPEEYR